MSRCCTRTTQIDFTWALERTASKFCKFKILPLLLSGSSQQISFFCFFRRKIKFSFYFLSAFFMNSCPFFAALFFPFTTLIPSNINNLPLVTFYPLLPILLHLYPYLVFLTVTQVTRSQPYIVLLCISGTGGLVNLCFLRVPLIPSPIICEVCLFLTYLLLIPF